MEALMVIDRQKAITELITELIQGKESAIQLQILLENSSGDDRGFSVLMAKVLDAFTNSLSLLKNSGENSDVCQSDNQVGSPCSDDRKSENSGEKRKTPAGKDRRGGYKRRMEIMLKWILLVLILELGNLANGGDVLNTNKVVSSVKEKLGNVSVSATMPGWCIFKVPSSIAGNRSDYTPKLVSIGPFHRGSKELKAMEVYKLVYLKAVLDRVPKMTIEDFVDSLGPLEERARRCYSETFNLTIDEFVEMMLIDASFVIEFMIRSSYNDADPRLSNDLIFSSWFMYLGVQTDLELLENQLPFFVIDHLFNLWFNGLPLTQYIHHAFLDGYNNSLTMTNFTSFVDVFRAYLEPKSERKIPKGDFKSIPTATELDDTGIEFKMDTEGKSLCDVILRKKKVLSIPNITLSYSTLAALRNVIALEQFIISSQVTDYTYLMDYLINTEGDVKLLRSKGILDTAGYSDQEVADIFGSLTIGTTFDPENFFYSQLFEELNAYHNKRWNSWKAKLKRDKFSSPWSIIGLIGGILLLVCSILQTYFAYKSTHKKTTAVNGE